MVERLYKRRELRERLNISNYEIKKLEREGILPEPLRFEGGHPKWTESQIQNCERALWRKANPQPEPALPQGGISAKLFKEIREAYRK
jgi:hypothetical protein